MELQKYIRDGVFSPALVSDELRTNRRELATTLGLGKGAFSRTARTRAPKSQTRLRLVLEIINRVEADTGSVLAAYAWFRSAPLPGFGGATPGQLVRQGEGDYVLAYLERVAAGGYA